MDLEEVFSFYAALKSVVHCKSFETLELSFRHGSKIVYPKKHLAIGERKTQRSIF